MFRQTKIHPYPRRIGGSLGELNNLRNDLAEFRRLRNEARESYHNWTVYRREHPNDPEANAAITAAADEIREYSAQIDILRDEIRGLIHRMTSHFSYSSPAA